MNKIFDISIPVPINEDEKIEYNTKQLVRTLKKLVYIKEFNPFIEKTIDYIYKNKEKTSLSLFENFIKTIDNEISTTLLNFHTFIRECLKKVCEEEVYFNENFFNKMESKFKEIFSKEKYFIS